MHKVYFSLILMIVSFSLYGQKTISGYITDGETGESLIGATILNQNQNIGTSTNGYGFFNLKTDADSVYLWVSFVGYKVRNIYLKNTQDTVLHISLFPGVNIEEVDVIYYSSIEKGSEMSKLNISSSLIKKMPALAGEKDLIKTLHFFPGIQQGKEGSSEMFVRGGSPDQNLISIDDVPLYYVNHLGGFVSIFNNDIVNDVTMIKGAFPARYGSRLSSIIDVKMKNGNLKKNKVSGTIGMVTCKLSAEGPIKKDTSSFIISGRRFMYDLFSRPITKIITGIASTGYTFYDVNFKFNHMFDQNTRAYFSLYHGLDRFTTKISGKGIEGSTSNERSWGNTAFSFRLNHRLNSRLFSNYTIYYTTFKHGTDNNYLIDDGFQNYYSYQSSINDFAFKMDFDQSILPKYKIKYGGGGLYHHFIPTETNTIITNTISTESDFVTNTMNSFEYYLYGENLFQIGNHFYANFGARFSSYTIENSNFHNLEPRISVSYHFSKNSIKFGATRMTQYVHRLTNGGEGMPSDYWIPATQKLRPSIATQIGLGYIYQSYDHTYKFTIEPYYKITENLVSFKEGAGFIHATDNWQENILSNGSGTSKGIEFLMEKNKGEYTGWLAYTYSKSINQFDELNNGESYPAPYDRTHNLNIVATKQINEHIDFSLTWSFATGSPFTMPISHYYTIDDNLWFQGDDYKIKVAEVYSKRNEYRMRSYHRLDLAMNFYKKKKWGTRTWSIGLYNAYNRKNPNYYFWDVPSGSSKDYSQNTKSLYQYSFFPILPSISYSFEFE